MKRFFATLILTAFIILSQLQLVHAIDMSNHFDFQHNENHEIKQPIFCETTGESHESDCTKDAIPYKLTILKESSKCIEKFSYVIPTFFLRKEVFKITSSTKYTRIDPSAPIYQSTQYTNLIEILKRLV